MVAQNPAQNPIHEAQAGIEDRVLGVTRLLAVVIIPVLTVAFIILYLFPNDTGRLFAWPIKPTVTARLLGATYLGGMYFFTRVFLTRQWHTVRLGYLPITAFVIVMGIATLLHWDVFTHGHVSFLTWTLLYFTLPFVIPVVWYFNQRVNRRGVSRQERLFSNRLRLVLGVIGAGMTFTSVVLLVTPQLVIPIWPWTLSPLTARVLSAMFILTGLVELGTAIDGRWSSARDIFQAQALAVAFFILAILLSAGQIQWTQPVSWLFLSGLLLALLLISLAAWEARRSRLV